MKKRMISAMAVVTLMLTTTMTTFAASSSPVMFGDNVQRTHENGFTDKSPWAKEVFLGSGAAGGISLASSSTAIGAGNVMYYPVSAGTEGNNFTGTGYMTIWDMSQWAWDSSTSQDEPTLLNKIPIPNVSNSSPVYDPSTGYAYLAAGGTFYKFNSSGEVGNVGISVSNPIDANQVVSYPLYATASELGTSTDEIWISSQNGYLFAVDPSTMKIIQKVYLGQRLDASPSLATATDGTTYIAVTAADSPNNKPITLGGTTYPGTGFLFLVNPRDGAVTTTVPNPSGSAISSTASPVSINEKIKGGIMWNDIDGDVFLGTVNPNGTATAVHQWPHIGNGQTSDYSESGYSANANEYVVPFTNGGTYGFGTVNPSTYQVGQVTVAGSSGPITPVGSPEISNGDGSGNDNLYLADQAGGLNEISADPTNHQFDGKYGGFLPSYGSSAGTTLSTPSELMLDTKIGIEAPTLTLATSQGLELWANGIEKGENLTFEQNYTSSSPTQISQSLTLTPSGSSLPTDLGNTDKIDFDMILNGGVKVDDIGSVATYDASGNPITGQIAIPTATLNSWLAKYEQQYPNVWQNNAQNNAVIEAYSDSTDQFIYDFTGSTAIGNGQAAEVTITFPAPNNVPPTPPSNPSLWCVQSGGLSCSSTEPNNPSTGQGYMEWRFLSPGMFNVLEGVTYHDSNVLGSDPITGSTTAYKLHPIPEQAINSIPAEKYTSYYTYQRDPGNRNDTQTGNWLNNFTVEFVNSTGAAANVNVSGQMKTIGDMLYKKTYVGAWQPHWSQACSLFGCWWVWDGYTPVYDTEYLYRNVAVDERIPSFSFSMPSTQSAPHQNTYWWNPNTVNVTATGAFSSEDTPITPAGSSLSWSQPVWASYGPWESSNDANTTYYEQVPTTSGFPSYNKPTTLTPNSMLPGTPTDTSVFAAGVQAPDSLGGTWYSDAPMPPIPAPGDSSLQGMPVSHPFDSEHNGGVIFPPKVANYPGAAPEWWVMPIYSASGTNFEHNQISVWISTGNVDYAIPWQNNAGEGVVSSETSSVTWTN